MDRGVHVYILHGRVSNKTSTVLIDLVKNQIKYKYGPIFMLIRWKFKLSRCLDIVNVESIMCQNRRTGPV